MGITSYQHADSDGDSFSVTFGPPPVVTAEADEDEQAEKLPALPKDAARLAYQLGNQ